MPDGPPASGGDQQLRQRIVAEFRANAGRVGGLFKDMTLCLLTTVGARSGVSRTVPLGYLEVDGQPLVVASAGGAVRDPGWYHNIRKNPRVTVEVGTLIYPAIAMIPVGAERARLFDRAVELAPGYAEYQARVGRLIPVVTLHRLPDGS